MALVILRKEVAEGLARFGSGFSSKLGFWISWVGHDEIGK
jgi:hypothetical protein